tara:strand:- start:401 stop:1141 length:741 start_codon:yes stop_codon:yes gene_type:complete
MSEELFCKHCNYFTSRRNNLTRHLNSQKHKDALSKKFVCDFCNRKYNHHSSLSRHVKQCKSKVTNIVQHVQNIVNNNTQIINNKMTINFFLTDSCKDAMNLEDFLSKIEVSLDDLLFTKDNGYIKGISNIFVKNLKEIQATQRPIHCSDKKRLQFYVKDENKWDRDTKNKKIDKTIGVIAKKQIQQIKMWEKENPNWAENDELTLEYVKMIQRVMGNVDNVDEDTSIKKNISNAICIKAAMLNSSE